MKDPGHHLRVMQWKRSNTDGKTFKQGPVGLSHREIQTEIMKIDPKAADSHAVMLFVPQTVVSIGNVLVITMDQRKTLVKLFRKNKVDIYKIMVPESRAYTSRSNVFCSYQTHYQ